MLPKKTDLGKFQGFGLGSAKASTTVPSKAKAGAIGFNAFAAPPQAGAAAKAKAPANGVAALFQESLEEEQARGGPNGVPSWSKMPVEALQAQRQAEAIMAEDPTVFQYDEVIDDIKEEMNLEATASSIRTDVMQQKKRVGLTVPAGAEEVKTGSKRSAKYIEKVIVATDRRKVEQQIIEDRLLKKEKEARKDCEVLVTEAFKEELKRRKKFEDELEAQDLRDSIKAAEKQEHGLGFADMYRNLLNGGLATSRGCEKIRELAPAREDLPEVKLEEFEAKAEVKEELDVKEEVKKEEEEEKLLIPAAPALFREKVQAAAEDKKVREEKAMSAKERYLARKKGQAVAEEEAPAG